jgi:hypothetical protein
MGSYQERDLLAMTNDILLSVIDGKPIRTDAIDRLPPYHARLVVQVALRAGATLQQGTPEQFERAAVAAGKQDARQAGWWRAELGMQPGEDPVPPTSFPIPIPARPKTHIPKLG